MRLTHPLAYGVAALALVFLSGLPAAAQVPIHGVTGTLVTPATAEAERKAEDAAASGAGSGLHKIGTAFKTLFGIHPSKGVLDELLPGTTVVVRGPVRSTRTVDANLDADDPLARVSEGSVVSVDKKRQSVVVKFGSGATTTYILRDGVKSSAASTRAADDADRVSLSYTDKTGQKVTHAFNEV